MSNDFREESLLERCARTAYEAYGHNSGGKNYQGLPMPSWSELPERIRSFWVFAVRAVLDAVGVVV